MQFPPEVVTAVMRHMNDDHTDDSLLIVRAFGPKGCERATSASMSGLDDTAGYWRAELPSGSVGVRVPWPGGTIGERVQIRLEVVKLYDAACERLGVEPRAHD